jgi:hypothetical protein
MNIMETTNQNSNPNALSDKDNVSYREFLNKEGFSLNKAMKDFSELKKEYQEICIKNNKEIIEKLKLIVSENYFKAINEFLLDKELGIHGELEIVSNSIGDWQEELNDWTKDEYWKELKGMYVNQSCGYSGDEYSGTLEINISKGVFLRCSFSL